MDLYASGRLKFLTLCFGSLKKSHPSKTPTGIQSPGDLYAWWGQSKRKGALVASLMLLLFISWGSSFWSKNTRRFVRNLSKPRSISWTSDIYHMLLAILLFLVLSNMTLGKLYLVEKMKQMFSSDAILPLLLLRMSWVSVCVRVCLRAQS